MRMRGALLFLMVVMVGCSGATSSEGTTSSSSSSSGDPDAGMTVDCSNRPTDAPSVRSELGGVLDEARNRLIVYGGNTAVATQCNVPAPSLTGETWAFHLDCNTWEKLDVPGPGDRARFAYAVDTQRQRMLIFGGRDRNNNTYRNLNDVYAFDLATSTWSAVVTTGDAPPPRSSPVAVYDDVNDRLIIFGGNSSTSGLSLVGINDMYALDLATNTWSELTAPDAPADRLYHSAVVVGRDMVVFGGTPNFNGPFYEDTHAYNMDTDTWRRISSGGVESRFGGEIFADVANNRILLFGGHDNTAMGNRNDVWALDLAAGTWSEVRPGDTLSGSPAGQCDFPADFTTPEANSPERRYSFVRAQGSTAGYIFAGKTDCGAVSDVWKLSFTDGTWEKLRTTAGGEACNRTGSTTCSSLCF